MKRIGKTLIENEPKGTTELIKIYAINFKETNRKLVLMMMKRNIIILIVVDILIMTLMMMMMIKGKSRRVYHLFVRQPTELKDFLNI